MGSGFRGRVLVGWLKWWADTAQAPGENQWKGVRPAIGTDVLLTWSRGELCQEAGLENRPLDLWPCSERAGFDCAGAGCVKTTAYFRDVVRQKHPGIEEAWILRVMAEPLEGRRQADGRFALWGLVPEAQNRALRVVTLDDRETVHNAFFDRGFLKARTRSQPTPPAEKPAP